MISNIVKSKIEFESKLITSTNPFFIDARNGMLKEQVVKDYLHNIFYLFKQTVTCLDDAHRRALEAGSPELAEFFKEKIKEELGHDQWARSDLLKFGDNIELVQLEKLKPSMIELVNYIRETIEEDPKLYLIYMFFAEYFTVLAAPNFLKNLQEKCGISRDKLTALSNHEELDRDHADEDMLMIDRFIGTPADPEPYYRVIRNTSGFISRFLEETARRPS